VGTVATEFQFKVAELNFHSTSYDWLVISGAKAQYKGSGALNGTGDYSFILTCTDGQINGGGGADKFRMKIRNKTTGDVIYDNQMGASDTSAATTVIGGGSIVIQSSSGNKSASVEGATIASTAAAIPLQFSLAQNAPNPFSDGTQIGFTLPERSHVRLTVFDVAGREIVSLADGAWDAGVHTVRWSGQSRAGSAARGGVYFVRIVAESVTGNQRYASLKKMIRID